jgi:hypothetical protein
LIKGWRRYTWKEMMQKSSLDSTFRINSLKIDGIITHRSKSIQSGTQVVVIADSAVSSIKTDMKGHFPLENDKILTELTKRVRIMVMEKKQDDFEIHLNDPYLRINQLLAGKLKNDTFAPTENTNSELLSLKGFEHYINLQEVKIKASKANYMSSSFDAGWGSNSCGDYVCVFGILNCANHRNNMGNKPPTVGKNYIVKGGEFITYVGCTLPDQSMAKALFTFDGIKYSKEFYGSDYSQYNPPQPEYISTIYWKQQVKIDALNKTKLQFYTSDITGPFKIIVQGITGRDIIYGEQEFQVQ